MTAKYILRFDDIAPGMAWSKFLPLKRELEELGIRCLLGVVPDCRDRALSVEADAPNFFDRIRAWTAYGDAIAQHGTFHRYDSDDAGLLGINFRSEFAGHEYEVQLARLRLGKEILVREGVWQPWFMAPAHSFDKNTLDALRALEFRAITDGYGFYPYEARSMLLVPQLVSYPLSMAFGYQTICVHINGLAQNEYNELFTFVKQNVGQFVDFKRVVEDGAVSGICASMLRICTARYLKYRRRRNQKFNVMG